MSESEWKWQDCYLEAFLDTVPENLVERVATAERAISLRTKELGRGIEAQQEWQAIADAMGGLAILKREIKAERGTETERRPAFGAITSDMAEGRGRGTVLRAQPISGPAKN